MHLAQHLVLISKLLVNVGIVVERATFLSPLVLFLSLTTLPPKMKWL